MKYCYNYGKTYHELLKLLLKTVLITWPLICKQPDNFSSSYQIVLELVGCEAVLLFRAWNIMTWNNAFLQLLIFWKENKFSYLLFRPMADLKWYLKMNLEKKSLHDW